MVAMPHRAATNQHLPPDGPRLI